MTDDLTADADLEEFLTHWYGLPKSEPLVPEGTEPLPLRCWYGYTEAWQQELAKQNRALRADELTALEGKTVFYVENQRAWLWGYGDGPNPEVFDRASDTGAHWAQTGERLDMFLWHMAVFEAALSGPYNLAANDLSLEEIELCTGLLDLCPFEPWRFPGPDEPAVVERRPRGAHGCQPSRRWRGDRRDTLGPFRGRPYPGSP